MLTSLNLGHQCRACRNGNTCAYDAVCTKAVQSCYIRDVHGTALTLTIPCFLTEQLCQHFIQRCALCDTVTMPSVGRCHIIFGLQCIASTCGHCLLPDAQVNIPCQHTLCEAFCRFCFKCSDTQHCFVHIQKHFLGIFFTFRSQCDSHLSFFSFFLCFFIFAWVQTEAPRVPHQIFCP